MKTKHLTNTIAWSGLLVTLFLCFIYGENKTAVEVVQPKQDTTDVYYNELPERIHRLWVVRNK
jgi:hypothetical protein